MNRMIQQTNHWASFTFWSFSFALTYCLTYCRFMAQMFKTSLLKLENALKQNRRVPLLDCGWTVAISGRYVVWFRKLWECVCVWWISRSAQELHYRQTWLAWAQIIQELIFSAGLNCSRLDWLSFWAEIKVEGLQPEWCIGIPTSRDVRFRRSLVSFC